MISCYIIGDGHTIDLLSQHIEKFPLTNLIGASPQVVGNLDFLYTDLPNLLFVDTSFITRFKTALMTMGKRCNIVYIAESTDYAFDAFETFALDYLMKPLTFELFERSINKFINFSLAAPPNVAKRHQPITDSFFIRSDTKGMKEILIKCKDVIFIESNQNYVEVHTDKQSYVSHNTLRDMEENLTGRCFIRVHKSFIINYDRISSLEGGIILLNENIKIPIGLTYKKAFLDRMSQKIIRKRNFSTLTSFSQYVAKIFLVVNLIEYGTIFC